MDEIQCVTKLAECAVCAAPEVGSKLSQFMNSNIRVRDALAVAIGIVGGNQIFNAIK